MEEEKIWMLMTYYCPTHGDSGIVKQIEITRKEISKTLLKKGKTSDKWLLFIELNLGKEFLDLN